LIYIYRIVILIGLLQFSFSQNFSWITPNKPYLKLSIIEDGIYRINKADFIQAGIQVNFDPRTVKVLFRGSQIPVYFEGVSDGIFNDSDFFDFYGTRNYGGLTNTYKEFGSSTIVDYITNEYYNPYSDTNVYWVGWDGANGLRFTNYSYTTQVNYPQNYFYDVIHFEKDSVYSLGETVNPNTDFRYFNTEKVSGEGWYWQDMKNGFFVQPSFSIPYLSNENVNCSFRIFAYPNSRDTSFNEHKLVLKANTTTITTLARNDYTRFDTTINFSSSFFSSAGNNNVTVTYTPTFSNPEAEPHLYFDLIEIKYPRKFVFANNLIKFNVGGNDTNSFTYNIVGINANNPLVIYDVNNNLKITSYSINTDTLSFTGKGNGNFEVINKYITNKPFRIENRQVQDLLSANNKALYLVIYNNLFTQQAEQLRQHRESHDQMLSIKASMDDIVDIFNYGIYNPAAIRNFTNYAYHTWQQPHLSYVCLMGRGSLDPKNIVNHSSFYKDLIPVYGNPPTDGYFSNFKFGTFTYDHNIAIGRLPVYTQQEAQDVVNKIINYDNSPTGIWWKTFIMITGGGNRNEQLQFQSQANNFLNNYIKFPPLSQDGHKIYRNDSAGYVTFNYKDSIRNEINRGGMIVNFIGHAASQDWEVGLSDPNILSNYNKLPLVLSMTCFTGRNSEPGMRGFGEKFVYLPDKCAIGFVGSTGWSYSTQGNLYNGYMLQAYSSDSVRRIGDLLKFATTKLMPDSGIFPFKNTINSYNLLGDPATKLLIPPSPEFEIQSTDYVISNPYPSVNENINLKIFPKNLGTYADSCKIRFQVLQNNRVYILRDTIIRSFAFADTALYNFKLDTIGNYSVKITLDNDNWYNERYENNNILSFQLPLRNISFLPLKPIDNSVIEDDSVQIVGLNPQLTKNANIQVILQIDTGFSFVNPIYKTTSNVNGPASKFTYHLPYTDSNKVFFWRTNTVINGDSTGWTGTSRFVYNPLNSLAADKLRSYDSSVTIYTRLPNQIDNFNSSNLLFNGSGFELKNFTGELTSHSFGSNGFEASYFIINNFTLYIDGGNNPGLNIVKVSRLTGKYLEFKNFRLPVAQSNDTLLSFLNTFDTTQFIMLLNASYTPSVPLSAAVKNKIKQFGSMYVDSVQSIGAFDTWAFIGYLGAAPANAQEEYHNYNPSGTWTPSTVSINPVFLNTKGGFSFTPGPSHRWKYLSWNSTLFPNSYVNFDVSGIKQNGDTTIFYKGINNPFINLDTLNNFTYPDVKLDAHIYIDTLLGLRSPIFKSLKFNYTPPAEILPDNFSFIRSDSVIEEGLPVTISVKYYNEGYVPANVIINKWTALTYNGIRIIKTDTVYTPLHPDSSRTANITFSTAGLRNRTTTADTVDIFFECEIAGNNIDYYPFNNFALTNIVITGDSLPPSIEVTFDGQKIMDGDLIPAKPEIKFKFYDETDISYTLADTANIKIMLDNQVVKYNLDGSPNPQIEFTPMNDGNLKAIVTFRPVLTEGEHNFRFIGADKNNNSADTLSIRTNVSYAFKVRELYNFPNPMRGDTYFTFNLFAEKSPERCRIKIYTVAGRLIKEITAPAHVGYNQIYWDGRDNDGETIANGIYLYKLILEDTDKTETAIQKLAILK